MKKKIMSLVVIFIFTTIAWFILGGVTNSRTYEYGNNVRNAIGQLWGAEQKQSAPAVTYVVRQERTYEQNNIKKTTYDDVVYDGRIEGSDIGVKIAQDYRKKGLMWYSTYKVAFDGKYVIKNETGAARTLYFKYRFPANDGIYSNFFARVGGDKVSTNGTNGGVLSIPVYLEQGKTQTVEISYDSQGMSQWWYTFGDGVSNINNFKLVMETDFDRIDFPENTISPVEKVKKGDGWVLTWKYNNLISGVQIGMVLPDRINPGPFATRVCFFAPVSFFFFLFLMFIITTVRRIYIHPMNYFFIASAFFAFHLLLSYLADHVDIGLAFVISSIVSIALVVSYMRLVVNLKFALVEIGLSQLIYLVVFSAAFFLDGYTGLTVTVLAIVTLFIVMQTTGRIDWRNYEDKAEVKGK